MCSAIIMLNGCANTQVRLGEQKVRLCVRGDCDDDVDDEADGDDAAMCRLVRNNRLVRGGDFDVSLFIRND